MLGKVLKFYASMANGLQLKVGKFGDLVPMCEEVTGEKFVLLKLFYLNLFVSTF